MYAIIFIIANLTAFGAVVSYYLIEETISEILRQIHLKKCADKALKQFRLRYKIRQRRTL